MKRDVLKRSYIGAILVNRQGATAVGGKSYNRVGGADAEFNLTDHYKVKAFWMGSATPGVRSGAGSSRLESIFENDLYRFITVYEDVGAKFTSILWPICLQAKAEVCSARAADGIRDAD